jgi:hypothetical protein
MPIKEMPKLPKLPKIKDENHSYISKFLSGIN